MGTGDGPAEPAPGAGKTHLPLFPLTTVLYPGAVLPLHVFEPRYRKLVGDLLALPDEQPRRFGVVLIELGHEVERRPGDSRAVRLARTGCIADIRDVTVHPDGTLDVLAIAAGRFRLNEVRTGGDYLTAAVTLLDEDAGTVPAQLCGTVSALLVRYREVLAGLGITAPPAEPVSGELPTSPIELSYAVAAAMVLDRAEATQLLEAGTAAARLRAAGELLRRELALLAMFPAVPAMRPLSEEGQVN